MNASELTKSLANYSSAVDNSVNLIVSATQPLAYIIIGVFFLLELDSQYKYFKQEGAGLTANVWMELALKYIFTYLLVFYSSTIFDAILELFNIGIKLVDKVLPNTDSAFNVDLSKIKGWFLKNVIGLIGNIVNFVAGLSTKVIAMMRYFQMYVLKALGPLMVAFFMSDATRPTMINVLKMFASAALQGIILIIVLRLYPAIVTDDLLKLNDSGADGLYIAFSSIAKGIIFIFMLFGSQRVAKNLIGSN
ncbi:TPA: type IV secretion system protein [Streptococcus suis]|nr:type IV secretion system protein [Streptococcus suis]